MIFEMLAGRPPFLPPSRDAFALADMKRHEDPPDLAEVAPQAPETLAALVMRTLDREPMARPSAAELEHGLAQELALLRSGS
jgi:serine/threonine protein kinase